MLDEKYISKKSEPFLLLMCLGYWKRIILKLFNLNCLLIATMQKNSLTMS